MMPSVSRSPGFSCCRSAPSAVAPAAEQAPTFTAPMWRTASTGLGVVKWAAAAGLLAGAAGLGTGAAAGCAAGAAVLGTVVWIGEMASIRYSFKLPHATLQHALCNELHTLAGGLLGATPVAAALTALGAALATANPAGMPEISYNGLAMLTAAVAGPTAILLGAAARMAPADTSSSIRQMMVYGLPLLATGAVLAAPAIVLHAAVSTEASSRFVITFGASMACAAVREGLTQASARAWGGLERSGVGMNYGLSQAQGAERMASTLAPTAASCLLFAATTGLLVHQLDAWCGLGMAPAGHSVLSMSAGEAARRTALRYTLMHSTNELLEGVARCLPLAAYARVRGIPLRYLDNGDGAKQVPAQLRRKLADPATLRRAALFASARTMDGALSNVLSQIAVAAAPGVFWNGYRVAAVLVQGATMARTPFIAAWLLPAPGADEDDGWPEATAAGDVALAAPAEAADSASDASTSTANPLSDPAVSWA